MEGGGGGARGWGARISELFYKESKYKKMGGGGARVSELFLLRIEIKKNVFLFFWRGGMGGERGA